VSDEDFRLRCEPNAPSVGLQQAHADLLFEDGQLLRDGRGAARHGIRHGS
jgi:hypothetical protein